MTEALSSANSVEPVVVTNRDKFHLWMGRRNRLRRRLDVVAALAAVAIVAAGAIYWTAFSHQYRAIHTLRSAGFSVAWDMNWSNFWTGGETSAGYHLTWQNIDLQGAPPGVVALGSLNHLKTLNLSDTSRFRDDDLAVLATLTELEDLQLNQDLWRSQARRRSSTPLTDRVLDHVQGLTRLQILGLANSAVTDAGLPRLAKLQALEMLDLDGTRVTDAGLDALADLKSLRSLHVTGTGVTKEGAARLRRMCPEVDVVLRREVDESGRPLRGAAP
jgi:Leucine-rich repeat (LRR) protein